MAAKFSIGWRQVAASLFLMAAGAMVSSGYSVVAVPLGEEFRPSRMVLMLTMTIMALAGGLMSPLLGSLMDRISLRLLMLLGAGSLVVGFVAVSFATTFTQVLVIYGVFMAPANILVGPLAASVLLSRWFVRRRGTALGFAIAGVSLGGFIYPPLIQLLLDHYEWREAFRLLALIVFLTTIPAAALVVNRPADRGLHADGAEADPEVHRSDAPAAQLSTRAILTDPTFWIVATVLSVVMSGMMGMVTNLVPLAMDEGIAPTAAALLISIYSGFGFLAKLVFAAVADRLNPRYLVFAALGGFGLGMACIIGAEAGYWLIAAGVGLLGLFGGLMTPLQGLLIARIFGPAVVGRVSGLMTVVILSALLATPPVFGLIYDVTGDYDAIFIAFTALAAATMLIVPYMRLHPKATAPESADRREQAGVGLAEPALAQRQDR